MPSPFSKAGGLMERATDVKVRRNILSSLRIPVIAGTALLAASGALTPAPAVAKAGPAVQKQVATTAVSDKGPNPADFPSLLPEGADAPDFTVRDKDDKPINLSDFRGKIVVVEFWETFCKPCQQAMPHVNEVVSRYKDQDVVLLGVDFLESPKTFKKWVSKHQDLDAFTFVLDPTKDEKNVAQRLYTVSITPTVYVIGKDGKIVQTLIGYPGPDNRLEQALKKAGVVDKVAAANGEGAKG
jgi:peroxiredoxin